MEEFISKKKYPVAAELLEHFQDLDRKKVKYE